MGKRFLLRQCERSHFFLRFLMFFVCRNQGMAVNVDQVLQDLAATLEAAISTKYNNALSYLSPGNLDTNSDALKSYIYRSDFNGREFFEEVACWRSGDKHTSWAPDAADFVGAAAV